MGRSVLMYDDSQKQTNSANGDGSTILNMDLINKQQMQKSLMLNQEESFLRERTNAMQTVEQTIVELGGMFQQLATMIKEQDESIQRIDSNIDDVDMNVSEAHSELLKYFQSVTSNRWLMIKVFFVLITFFIVFVVVMT
jgi:syntaxin 5